MQLAGANYYYILAATRIIATRIPVPDFLQDITST
jgi:hypothetical protein